MFTPKPLFKGARIALLAAASSCDCVDAEHCREIVEKSKKVLEEKGLVCDYEEVLRDIRYRDEQDSHRTAAPLKAAEDAVLVDTTALDRNESFALLCSLIRERLGLEAQA